MEEILHAKWSRQTASEWVEWSGVEGGSAHVHIVRSRLKKQLICAPAVCVCSRTLNVSSSLVAVAVVVVVVFVIVLTATSSSGS